MKLSHDILCPGEPKAANIAFSPSSRLSGVRAVWGDRFVAGGDVGNPPKNRPRSELISAAARLFDVLPRVAVAAQGLDVLHQVAARRNRGTRLSSMTVVCSRPRRSQRLPYLSHRDSNSSTVKPPSAFNLPGVGQAERPSSAGSLYAKASDRQRDLPSALDPVALLIVRTATLVHLPQLLAGALLPLPHSRVTAKLEKGL